ncbi:MAG: 3-phosphoserine/phosphohydroxythreonine transaminase [Propionicimonas sp.]|uniref:3-phosphoserine/phosphohydroxythreonine transaminase n=1 Tax=Propionicimonas sp. TaxID=1955623 RepID=UPI002B1FEA7B|nr:3-phosphoserine/phosphohydroxythreonine transaminase [Propionicimonas sp.]MEA4945594.1 3-phosphoserine/phosphohydroxythreonine transaminase [Propionicimonas sp.]MEA5055264.1 3-phosphoserine/phosphohydroxythreonine transaminase [Propionicimonas sp.]
MRAYNFSAGPAMLPLAVLEQARSELTDWGGSGMSVMEVSHRGKAFVACAAQAEALLREVLGVPDDYKVLFLQGGASAQFDAIPLNLTQPGEIVDFLNTGQWSTKAIAASKRQGLQVEVIADEKASNYTTVPAPGSYQVNPAAAYLHYTPNETIGGVEFDHIPASGEVPLVADFSSTILSRPIDVSGYGLIYAGAQKNMGPSGLCVVIVREDLLGHARSATPAVLEYAGMAASDSMLNTPPTFSIYLLGLILAWVKSNGGLTAMAERNRAKADALYTAIDDSPFYRNPVAPNARSWMNVPFLVADPALEKPFVAEAAAAGLTNLAGHRSVGGMRASIYNAMPIEGVNALIDFMADFERRNG